MLRLLGGLLVVALAVGVLGWYLGWFQVGTTKDGDKTNVNIEVNTDKIQQTRKSAEEGVRKAGERAREHVDDLSKPKKDRAEASADK